MQRKPTKEIQIGKTAIGRNNSIAIKAVTTQGDAGFGKCQTVAQIRRLEEGVGCGDRPRRAVLTGEDAEALKEIKSKSKFLWSPTSIFRLPPALSWHFGSRR